MVLTRGTAASREKLVMGVGVELVAETIITVRFGAGLSKSNTTVSPFFWNAVIDGKRCAEAEGVALVPAEIGASTTGSNSPACDGGVGSESSSSKEPPPCWGVIGVTGPSSKPSNPAPMPMTGGLAGPPIGVLSPNISLIKPSGSLLDGV